MFRRLLCVPLLSVLLLPSVAAAATPNRTVRLAPEVAKLLGLRLKALILDEQEGGSSSVQVFPAVPDGNLVVARQRLDVETHHWRNNRFGEVRLVTHTPCEAFFSVDPSRIVCSYDPLSRVLTVRCPAVDILTITPEMTEQRRDYRTTGMRFKSFNRGVFRDLENEVPEGVRRVSRHEFQKTIPAIEADTRAGLQQFFDDLVRPIDPGVRVYVEEP
jgi:hypothetical protein